MKTLRNFSTFVMTFLFASVLACAAGETATQYVDDTAITTEVKSKILAQKDLPSSQIHVKTEKGTVQLTGYVSDQNQAQKAETIAKTIKGVQKVDNKLELKK